MKKKTPKEFMEEVSSYSTLEFSFYSGLKASDLDDSNKEFKNSVELAETYYNNFLRERDKIFDLYWKFEKEKNGSLKHELV